MNKSFNFSKFKKTTLCLLGKMLLFSNQTKIIYGNWDTHRGEGWEKIDTIVLPRTRLNLEAILNKKFAQSIALYFYTKCAIAYMDFYKNRSKYIFKKLPDTVDLCKQCINVDLQPFHQQDLTDLWGYIDDDKVAIFYLTNASEIIFLKPQIFRKNNGRYEIENIEARNNQRTKLILIN